MPPKMLSINPTFVPTKSPLTDREIRELQSTISILDVNNGSSNMNFITASFVIYAAIAVFLVGSCMFCGVIILCEKKIESNHMKFEEGVGEIHKHHLEIEPQTKSTQIKKILILN